MTVRDGTTPVAPPSPIDCETAVRRLWDYVDGRLPPGARDEVEAHLAVCALCPPHFAFARAMQAGLARSSSPAGSGDEHELRERVHRALHQLPERDEPERTNVDE